MGGIVAADTLLSILDDEPIRKKPTSPSSSSSSSRSGSLEVKKRRDSSSKPSSSRVSSSKTSLSKELSLKTSSSKTSSSSGKRHDDVLNDERMMFPAIIGICAFDTPYLGLSPSMFTNSAESNIRAASDTFTTVSSIAKTLGFFGSQEAAPAAPVATSSSGAQAAALPAAGQAASSGGGWGWGKLALAAAAATTVTAGAGTAVYMNRSNITQGFGWVTSHLEFVGVLFNNEELKSRVIRASSVPGVGIANFYTLLGKGAKPVSTTQGKTVEVGGGGVRTFCSLPPKPRSGSTATSTPTPTSPSPPESSKGKASAPSGSAAASFDNMGAPDIDIGNRDWRTWWHPQLNEKATDEANAHMYMFKQATNPAYKEMLDGAGKQVMRWSINWYDSRG
ncbi:hypothetical protein TWF718_011259 [Orbilia javanica]